jgi:hypothetical protein
MIGRKSFFNRTIIVNEVLVDQIASKIYWVLLDGSWDPRNPVLNLVS